MYRLTLDYLSNWLELADRRPLIIRGARQVGKTWLVREFSKEKDLDLLELNFERQLQLQTLFDSNEPQKILQNLNIFFNKSISPDKSLLFLDEIQAAPQILAKLRWFAEEVPELPVIAAGSLLEFALENPSFSMPVGRISYLYLEPLSFGEFLLAKNKEQLANYVKNYDLESNLPVLIHQELTELFNEYIIIGGMPAVVKSWTQQESLARIDQIKHDLLATYREDFGKYKGRLSIEKLDEVLTGIPLQLGHKFVYSRIDREMSSTTIKHAVKLVNKALVAHQVHATAANGVPLGAEVNPKNFKEIFLDVGLCSTALGLTLSQVQQTKDIVLINKGGIAEQVVGQLLRVVNPPYIEPRLYYWQREQKGSEAEIDYIIAHNNSVIPIEVKAGSTGSLKSLHLFMELKKLPLAIRINSDVPSITPVSVKNRTGEIVAYTLLSLPFYLVEQVHRFIRDYKIKSH